MYELICHRGICTKKGKADSIEECLNNKTITDAKQKGADYIEIDIALSSDGVLFIEHDSRKRFGTKIVFPGKIPFSEYKKISPNTLTLEEVLGTYPDTKFYLEIKRSTNYEVIIDKLYDKYVKDNFDKYIIHSMDTNPLDYAKSKDKRIRCSYIVTAPFFFRVPIVTKRQIDLAESRGYDELGGYIHAFPKSSVEYTKSKGIVPTTGYVNNMKQLEKANKLGITKFFTDNVDFFSEK